MRPLRPYEIKPHGSYEPKPERGAYLRREPKGDPDVLLFSFPDGEREIFAAADLLSVQGYTARIAVVSDAALFLKQEANYRNGIFADRPAARVGLALSADEQAALRELSPETELLNGAGRAEIARAALAAKQPSARGCCGKARTLKNVRASVKRPLFLPARKKYKTLYDFSFRSLANHGVRNVNL